MYLAPKSAPALQPYQQWLHNSTSSIVRNVSIVLFPRLISFCIGDAVFIQHFQKFMNKEDTRPAPFPTFLSHRDKKGPF